MINLQPMCSFTFDNVNSNIKYKKIYLVGWWAIKHGFTVNEVILWAHYL